jgi:acyl-lipid Delta6-acetylenase / acyl-lipid (9-3)-desaturase
MVAQAPIKKGRKFTEYSMDEVAKHTARDDLWIAIHGKVYNVGSWLARHPGGDLALLDLAGKDATAAFHVFHPKFVQEKLLTVFQVGVVKDYTPNPIQAELFEIYSELEEKGLLETDYTYYVKKTLVQMALMAACIGFMVYANLTDGATWKYMMSAVMLGTFWQQLSFLGHDFGHNAVTHDINLDWWGSILVTLTYGVSGQWWKLNHNTHHIVTNSVEHDPDIQHMPIMAVSENIFSQEKGFWSTYYEKIVRLDDAARFLVSHQHRIYYPLMAVARYYLYLNSFLLCLNPRKNVKARFVELGALIGFWVWFSYLCSFLPSTGMVVAFTLLSHAIVGLIHVQITLSHFAMETYYGYGYEQDHPNHFVECQLKTSLNVDCPEWLDWLHGGLQFQVEHHLLPRVPRHNLRYVRENYIEPYAKKHNLPYYSCTFWEANKMVYQALKTTAAKVKNYKVLPEDSNFLMRLLAADG